MSKYTTELRFICETEAGLSESVGLNDVKRIVTEACPKIFDDDIPFFDERYRLPLESKILMHYYTREISGETVGIWKLWLNNRMREIMPYYNQLYESTLLEFNPLLTKSFKEEYEGEGLKDGTRTLDREHSNTIEDVGATGAIGDATNNATDRRLYSDTPQGALTGVENETYLTNATKNIGSDVAHSENNVETSNTNTNTGTLGETNSNSENTSENYIRTITGYDGVSASKLLNEFRETILNIDVKVIAELGDLFFNLW